MSLKVPLGECGIAFVSELSLLYRAFAETSALEAVALKASVIMPGLLLQRPHPRSKTKENIACLERHLELWKNGDLLIEGRTLQRRMKQGRKMQGAKESSARSFAKKMFEGKTKDALQLLSNHVQGRPLHLGDTVTSSNGESVVVLDVVRNKRGTSA